MKAMKVKMMMEWTSFQKWDRPLKRSKEKRKGRMLKMLWIWIKQERSKKEAKMRKRTPKVTPTKLKAKKKPMRLMRRNPKRLISLLSGMRTKQQERTLLLVKLPMVDSELSRTRTKKRAHRETRSKKMVQQTLQTQKNRPELLRKAKTANVAETQVARTI